MVDEECQPDLDAGPTTKQQRLPSKSDEHNFSVSDEREAAELASERLQSPTERQPQQSPREMVTAGYSRLNASLDTYPPLSYWRYSNYRRAEKRWHNSYQLHGGV